MHDVTQILTPVEVGMPACRSSAHRIAVALLVAGAIMSPGRGDDWPQWRGPDRSNVSAETGLLRQWPKQGPPLVWKATGLGNGVASVAIAKGRIYTVGFRADAEWAIALDTAGHPAWQTRLGPAVQENFAMRWLSQRTPTVDADRAYFFTAHGELVCLQAVDGKEIWRRSYPKDFQGQRGHFGYCDYPLVDGAQLICTPGGSVATLIALDKATGALKWKCAVPGGDAAAYAAGVLVNAAGVRQVVTILQKGVVGVAAADGRFLWRYDRIANRIANSHTPMVNGDRILCANGYRTGLALVQLHRAGQGIEVNEKYFVPQTLDIWHGSTIKMKDLVFAHATGGFLCLDFATGQIRWGPTQHEVKGQFSVTGADGHLYFRSNTGRILLVEANPNALSVKGSFDLPDVAASAGSSFPVIAGGRLYLRQEDGLYCYDIRAAHAFRAADAIFVPTPQEVVEQMLALAGVKQNDVVYDLGCGDGRIVITAAERYGCKAVGYDLDPECVQLARAAVATARVGDRVRIEREDIFTLDLRGATVIMLYLGPQLNARLLPQLVKLRPGSRIVSHAFDLPGIKPDKLVKAACLEDGLDHRLYLWVTPLARPEESKPVSPGDRLQPSAAKSVRKKWGTGFGALLVASL